MPTVISTSHMSGTADEFSPDEEFYSRVLSESHGRDWSLYQGDCCEVIKGIPDDSVGLIVYSPPFSHLYSYSDSENDMGNCDTHEQFAEHYGYLTRELLRISKPGRLCVVHCKDLPLFKNRDGAMGLFALPDLLTRVHLETGWVLHSRVTIWKDPKIEMQRTKNHGLLYRELCKDSTGSRQGMADYLIVFRNWRDGAHDPVVGGEERFDCYVGTRPPDPTDIADDCEVHRPTPDHDGKWPKYNPFPPGSKAYRIWSIQVWRKYASPVWMDINQLDTLNERGTKEDGDTKHICPLQLDVIERAIHLWTNPGDVVFSPFAGIGSELYCALKTGRKAMGVELKGSYFDTAAKYLGVLEKELNVATLF